MIDKFNKHWPPRATDNSFKFLDEMEGMEDSIETEILTWTLAERYWKNTLAVRVQGFTVPRMSIIPANLMTTLEFQWVPSVTRSVAYLARCNGEAPTDLCLAWLALDRSLSAPKLV